MKKQPKINYYLKEDWYKPIVIYEQEEILTSFGRESRYQVYALDEDYLPSKFIGTEDSPINLYSLVDRNYGGYEILETIEADSYQDAYQIFRKIIIEKD
jgi:hypothetical protein